MEIDGLNSLKYDIVKTEEHPLYTQVVVDVVERSEKELERSVWLCESSHAAFIHQSSCTCTCDHNRTLCKSRVECVKSVLYFLSDERAFTAFARNVRPLLWRYFGSAPWSLVHTCEASARASTRIRKRKFFLFLVLALASRFHACEPGVLRLRLLHACEPGLNEMYRKNTVAKGTFTATKIINRLFARWRSMALGDYNQGRREVLWGSGQNIFLGAPMTWPGFIKRGIAH